MVMCLFEDSIVTLKIRTEISGAGTAYHSGAPEFTTGFSGFRGTRSLVLCVCFVDRCLFLRTFSFGNCIACPSSMYTF